MRKPAKDLVSAAAKGSIDRRLVRQYDRFRGWFELLMDDGSEFDSTQHDLPARVLLTRRAKQAYPEFRRSGS